jgi:hypothetical protein
MKLTSCRVPGGVLLPVNLHNTGEAHVGFVSRHASPLLVAACRPQYGILNIYSWLIRKSNVNKFEIM